jgi:hypothetical protein
MTFRVFKGNNPGIDVFELDFVCMFRETDRIECKSFLNVHLDP